MCGIVKCQNSQYVSPCRWLPSASIDSMHKPQHDVARCTMVRDPLEGKCCPYVELEPVYVSNVLHIHARNPCLLHTTR